MVEVTAAVVQKGATVLLTRRSPGRKEAGKWEFPGGKREQGETLAMALAREIWEEFSVKAEIGKEICRTVYTYPHGQICLIAFFAVLEEEPLVSTDHDAIEWVPLSGLLQYDLSPADVPVARHLTQNI